MTTSRIVPGSARREGGGPTATHRTYRTRPSRIKEISDPTRTSPRAIDYRESMRFRRKKSARRTPGSKCPAERAMAGRAETIGRAASAFHCRLELFRRQREAERLLPGRVGDFELEWD